MLEIDEAIGQVENLYRAVTGKSVPPFEEPYAPIPTDADPAAHVRIQMELLMEALHTLPQPRGMTGHPWMPAVSFFETPADVFVLIDLPGVTREHVNVTIEHGILVIEGQRSFQPPREGEPPRVVAEQPYGPFRRTVLLPPGLKTSELNAQLRDGVLEVRVPRLASSDAKNVPVA
jgi:HSP20 family protein